MLKNKVCLQYNTSDKEIRLPGRRIGYNPRSESSDQVVNGGLTSYGATRLDTAEPPPPPGLLTTKHVFIRQEHQERQNDDFTRKPEIMTCDHEIQQKTVMIWISQRYKTAGAMTKCALDVASFSESEQDEPLKPKMEVTPHNQQN